MQDSIIIQAFAVASSGLLSIGSILFTLFLLGSSNGLKKALAYTTAYFLGYLFIGYLFIFVGHFLPKQPPPFLQNIFSLSPLFLGSLLIFLGLRRWRNPSAKKRGPSFLEKIDEIKPQKLLLFGLFVTVVNFKNLALFLSAISILAFSSLSTSLKFLTLPFLTLFFTSTVFAPIFIYLLFPKYAPNILATFKNYLIRHQRPLSLSIIFLFGSIFLFKGLLNLQYLIR